MNTRRALPALILSAVVSMVAACSSSTAAHQPPAAELPPSKKPATCEGYVALTIDDAPSKLTDQYLDVLRFYNVHATFFLIGENAEMRPEETGRIAQAGHTLGHHTQTHAHMDELTQAQRAEEFAKPIEINEKLGLGKFTFWRPPYGGTTPEIRKEGEALGMAEVMWDLDTKDFETPDPQKVEMQAAGMKDGEILLVHDGKPQTLAALPTIINHYYSKGLCWGKLAKTGKEHKSENGPMYAVRAVKP